MKKNYSLLLFLPYACLVQVQDTHRTDKDVPYISSFEIDAYRLECCKPNVYYPKSGKDFPTTVWSHDGDMKGGSEFVSKELTGQGFTVVTVNYRLSPKTKNLAYIEDAAEAVAWTFRNIERYSSRKDRISVSGYSAGGYLTLVLAMDREYMAAHGADVDGVAAYFPVDGQTVTHFTIRKECGLSNGTSITGESAPVNKIRKDIAPVALTAGDKNLGVADRYGENTPLASILKSIDNRKALLYELQGFDHEQVFGPACYLIVNYVKRFK